MVRQTKGWVTHTCNQGVNWNPWTTGASHISFQMFWRLEYHSPSPKNLNSRLGQPPTEVPGWIMGWHNLSPRTIPWGSRPPRSAKVTSQIRVSFGILGVFKPLKPWFSTFNLLLLFLQQNSTKKFSPFPNDLQICSFQNKNWIFDKSIKFQVWKIQFLSICTSFWVVFAHLTVHVRQTRTD